MGRATCATLDREINYMSIPGSIFQCICSRLDLGFVTMSVNGYYLPGTGLIHSLLVALLYHLVFGSPPPRRQYRLTLL